MSFASADRTMMLHALTLARRGVGNVSPNPLVGCVIAGVDGEVIGEGAHLVFGGPHGEPNAVADAEAKGHSVRGSTVYVTLEPHSHQGKTPPCCDLLIEKRIGRCVVAMVDPYLPVNGEGIRRMRQAGIEVDVGLMEAEARELNRFFIKHITTGLPYVTLKLASSLDGRSALASGQSRWITSEASRRMVHRMRAEYDAVLVGTRTAELDDPALTVRLTEGRQPRRIVLDSKLELTETLKLFSDEYREKTIVVTSEVALRANDPKAKWLATQGIECIAIPILNERIDLRALFVELESRGIASLLVEAGPTLAAAIIGERLFDEIQVFMAPMLLGGDAKPMIGALNLPSLNDAIRFTTMTIEKVEDSQDFLVRVRV